MAGVQFTLTTGPETYPILLASTTISGGQVVEFDGTSGVRPASANSAVVVGVAVTDGAVAGTDALTGAGATANPRPATVTVVRAPYRVPVTAAAALTMGQPVKAAAAGAVALWVTGTDGAEKLIGYVDELAGIGNGSVGNIKLIRP